MGFVCSCGFLCFAHVLPSYLLLLLASSFLLVCAFAFLLLCFSASLLVCFAFLFLRLSASPLFFLSSAWNCFSFSACSGFCFCFSTFPRRRRRLLLLLLLLLLLPPPQPLLQEHRAQMDPFRTRSRSTNVFANGGPHPTRFLFMPISASGSWLNRQTRGRVYDISRT